MYDLSGYLRACRDRRQRELESGNTASTVSAYHFKRVVAGMSAVNDDRQDRGSYVKPIIEAEADILSRWLD